MAFVYLLEVIVDLIEAILEWILDLRKSERGRTWVYNVNSANASPGLGVQMSLGAPDCPPPSGGTLLTCYY